MDWTYSRNMGGGEAHDAVGQQSSAYATSSSTARRIVSITRSWKAGVHSSGFSALMPLIRSMPKSRWTVSSRRMYWNCSPMPVIRFCRWRERIMANPE